MRILIFLKSKCLKIYLLINCIWFQMKKLIRINSNLDAMIWPPSSSGKLSKVVILIPTWRHFWKFESLRIRVICRPIRINSNSTKSSSPSDNLLPILFAHSVVLIFVFIIFFEIMILGRPRLGSVPRPGCPCPRTSKKSFSSLDVLLPVFFVVPVVLVLGPATV